MGERKVKPFAAFWRRRVKPALREKVEQLILESRRKMKGYAAPQGHFARDCAD
jgi:hypothetical protein